MSRRKQAKPRPIFSYVDEHSGSRNVEDILVPISHTDRHVFPNTPDDQDDDDADFKQFAPLVMDVSVTDLTPASVIAPHPQSPNSITAMDALPSFTQLPRPELIKPSMLVPTFTNHLPIYIPNSILPVSSSPVSSFANSICCNNEKVSPVTTPSGSSSFDENSMCSVSSSAGNMLRRGTKILPVADEDGEKFICPVCSVSLLNLHDLTVHIRSHNTPVSGSQSNSCTICGKVLSSQSSLDRHMLVHSGERPFVCKICHMSFTTNGNMHRHSRIHTKEQSLKSPGNQFQMRRGKFALRHRINNLLNPSNSPVNMKSFQGSLPQDILKNCPNHSQQSVFVHPTDVTQPVAGTKRHCNSTELNSDWQIPMKRQSFGSNETDIDIVPRRYSYPIVPTKGREQEDLISEQSSDREDKEVLHCPVCSKTFLCKYGLESHIETHPESSSHCNTCNLTFKNPRKLRLHRLIVHTEKPKSDEEFEKGAKEDEKGMKKESELKIGFSDLTFVDFSVEKFPLIAKHYFEQNARVASSKYLNFMCKDCLKAFPCESSLILHMYTHTKEKCTQCPLCECDYADVNEFHAHMLKHLSDKAFEDIRPSANGEKGDDDLQPDRLTKHDFLAMFHLKEDEEKNEQKSLISSPKKEFKPIKVEKHQNNDYFAKLGQTYSPGIVPLFGDLPYLQHGFHSTVDDFHTILQIATKMNMLPNMGSELLKNNSKVTHTSPSAFMSFPESIVKSLISFPSSPKPAHTNSVPMYTGLNMTPVSLCNSTAQASEPETETSEIKRMNSGSISCNYCDNSFNSYKTLKSHIRTHLGFSPYQCNLCIYSSADKSSLIRHVRTHSGARPYHCLLCDFAFTTRANCERHIKNKHQLNDKDNIEKVIYLNKCALDAATSLDHFHSPDTICKYCGIDFKFFRALRNHLRSHVSDRQKPFQCKICYMGFCTKANCLRHVQQTHSDINDNQIENYIKVTEFLGNDDNDSESVASDDGIPLYTEDRRTSCSFETKSGITQPSSAPSSAPSSPKPDSVLRCDSDHVSPDQQISPNYNMSSLSHISHAQSEFVIKTEPAETPAETPIDFSLKSDNEPVRKDTIRYQLVSKLGNLLKTGSEETPIDLSVRRTVSHVPIAPKPPAVKFESSLLQCSQCPLGFSDIGALQRHISKCHPQLPNMENSMPSAAHLVVCPIMKNGGKLLVQPRASVSLSNVQFGMHAKMQTPNPATTAVQQKSVSVTIQNLQEKLKQKKELSARTPSASESDLASVTKMIDVTDPLNFQAFFHTDQSSDYSSPNTKLTSINKPFVMSKLPNMIKRPGVQISLEHCKAINRELDNLQREGDVDEAALSQVREMALSVKEEVISNPTTNAGQRTMSPVAMLNEGQNDEENSVDCSTSCVQKTEGEKSEIPVKKKRNSYADSPHKLACPYCPRAFPWVSSLTRHLLTHTGQKPFKCPRCPVTFSTKSNRERHLIRKHGVNMLDPLSRQTMDRPYKCPLCVFSSFSTQSNLLKHYHDRHNGANLPDSIAEIERMSPSAIKAATMEMEVRAAENSPQTDELSMNSMTNEDDEDMENSIEDSSEQMDDDSNPDSEVEVQDNLQRLEGESEKSDKSIPMLISPLTERSLITADPERIKVAPHVLVTMPEFKKNRNDHYLGKPDRKSDTENELERSQSPNTMKRNIEKIIAEQKAIIEQKTKMETVIQAEFRAQIEAQRKNENHSISPVLMDACQDLKFIDPTKPFTGSAEKIINPERDNYDVDKITECWKCKGIFTSRKILVRHLKEHNIDLPYKCYLCDASYDMRMDCLTHQADAHDSDWKILKSKNKVGNIEQFSVHMDKVVENNCNKLDSGSVLEIPGSGNDDSKMEVISADYMQRKVYCSLCPKRFWSLQDLRRHMRSHTGERPFECDVCQKRFTLKHSMMRHRKKHDGAPPPTFDEDDDDSNGTDDRAQKAIPKSIQSKSSNQFQYAVAFNTATNNIPESMPSVSSYLFTAGLSGGQMILGESNIASLTPASVLSSCRSSINNVTTSSDTSKDIAPTLDSVKKEFLDCSADMLHNLLGVESAAIEKMLEAADSKTAAKYLGITEVS